MGNYLKFLFSVLIFINIFTKILSNNCDTKDNCRSCIRSPGCVWCKKISNETIIRCSDQSHKDGWCPIEDIVNVTASQEIKEEVPVETGRGKKSVLISPQKISLKLKPGETQTIHFTYGQAEDYPVDLYYIMDLSSSMEKHRETLSKLGGKLAEAMNNLTSKFQLGFGSFVDKVELPFTSTVPSLLKEPCSLEGNKKCASPYSFKNHLSLTSNTELFNKEVENANVSGNLDAPEGGFDALMQAIVCKDVINWRDNARHLLVLSTDAMYHIAGDGKLAGIIEPNDGLCHMEKNNYNYSLLQDYPSIGQINEKAIENNINIIFTATDNVYNIYKDLAHVIKGSYVGRLINDSDNVVGLIKHIYSEIVASVKIVDNFDRNIEVIYSSTCNNGTNGVVTSECKNIHVGKHVNFTAKIKLIDCPEDGILRKKYRIKPNALDESLYIDIEMLCECECENLNSVGYEKKSERCSSNGDLVCGICECADQNFGTKCECNKNTALDHSDVSNCRKNNDSEICSSLGTCKCGECKCFPRKDPSEKYYGKYCECNNFSCGRHNGALCSGPERGNCTCGVCNCFAGWTGDNCGCSLKTDTCKSDSDAKICGGNGDCICGECVCNSTSGYSGKYCEKCPTCSVQKCKELRKCVECSAFNIDISRIECEKICAGIQINKTEELDKSLLNDENICHFPDNAGCTFKFLYKTDSEILIQTNKICSPSDNIEVIVSAVIGSILLAGLLLLGMWKILTTYYDHIEYVKFEKERQNAKWNRGENPLFKNPTSQFNNPTFGQ